MSHSSFGKVETTNYKKVDLGLNSQLSHTHTHTRFPFPCELFCSTVNSARVKSKPAGVFLFMKNRLIPQWNGQIRREIVRKAFFISVGKKANMNLSMQK